MNNKDWFDWFGSCDRPDITVMDGWHTKLLTYPLVVQIHNVLDLDFYTLYIDE